MQSHMEYIKMVPNHQPLLQMLFRPVVVCVLSELIASGQL